jgi:hypothetical protein
MNSEFPSALIELIKNKTLSLEYAKDWVERTYSKGKLDNLDYVELLNNLKEYERTQP